MKINWPSFGTTIELILWTFISGALGALYPIVIQDVQASSPIVWKTALTVAIITGLTAVVQRYRPVPEKKNQ